MKMPSCPSRLTLFLALAVSLEGCAGSARSSDDTAGAPADTGTDAESRPDTNAVTDTLTQPGRLPSVATPPITPPSEAALDTPPAGATPPSDQAPGAGGPKVSQAEYDGWRQYSVNCARCHGQDVLPNPVAANLLISLGPGGPIGSDQEFFQVVNEGRLERGMPAFKTTLTPEQIRAIYAYVDGRAEKRIPPGRPASPT
jgi:mono/diheme cytochrome c family protein